MSRVYLDHSATTPIREQVLQAMVPYFSEISGNASSLHMFGQRAKRALEESRRAVAGILDADPQEIIFTSGGTESDNLALKGAARAGRARGQHLITAAFEHHAILHTCRALEDEGFEVTYLPIDGQGIVDLDALKESIREDTLLVSVMLANNEVGTIQPLAEIASIARSRGVLLHTDAVQAVGKMPVNVAELGVDLLSLTAHKFYGPKGAGVLYVRRGTPINPLLHGGHQGGGNTPRYRQCRGGRWVGRCASFGLPRDGCRGEAIGGAARSAGGWHPRAAGESVPEWPSRVTPAAYPERELCWRRRGGASASARHEGHRGLHRFRLHRWRNGSLSRASINGRRSSFGARQPAVLPGSCQR